MNWREPALLAEDGTTTRSRLLQMRVQALHVCHCRPPARLACRHLNGFLPQPGEYRQSFLVVFALCLPVRPYREQDVRRASQQLEHIRARHSALGKERLQLGLGFRRRSSAEGTGHARERRPSER